GGAGGAGGAGAGGAAAGGGGRTAGRDMGVSDGGETPPPLILLTASLALIPAIRAAIAIGAFAALLAVFDNDRALRLAFAGGAGVLAVAALARARGSRYFALRERAEPWPPGARRASRASMALNAAYPSTIG